jgi:transposase
MQLGLQWYTWAMKPPIFIRPLTDDERMQLEAARRTAEAFRVRRAQIVLASARSLSPKPLAQLVGCSVQTVRNVIHAFNTQGMEGLEKQSNRPKTVEPLLDAAHCDRLQHFLHQSPRLYGKPTGVWTLALAAAVCYEQGVTERLLSDETIRVALKRLGTTWKRAKHWITSPDPQYARKKSGGIAC